MLQYLHSDHLGSTTLTTDSSGNSMGSQQYRAYGLQQGGDGVPTENQFTGQKQDGSGLQYFNARYYDPQTGLFVSPDTIVPDVLDVFSYNRSAYARLNPLRYNDPSGHDFWDVVATITDFASSVGAQIGYNNSVTPDEYNVYTPQAYESTSMVVGRHVGNVVSAAQGAIEMVGGAGMMGGGVAICGTGVGCLATPAVEAAGVAVAGHGAYVAANAVYEEATMVGNLVMSTMDGGGKQPSKPSWTNHGYKHYASGNQSWSETVKATEKGPAKYLAGTDVESLERMVWDQGQSANNGRDWKVMAFDKIIGASGGKESRWIRVEFSGNTIHGHPITEAEFLKLTK